MEVNHEISSDDPLLKDIPAIADHALATLDRLQGRTSHLREVETTPEEGEDKKPAEFRNMGDINCTHAGNGERFILWFGNKVRYCPPFEWWFIWNEKEGRWARDEMGQIFENGKSVIKYLYIEAANAPNKDRRQEIAKWAILCEKPGAVTQLLESARTDPEIAVGIDLFDSDPLHLNLLNGWVDLQTMELHPHSKKKFFTMMIPVSYDPTATCPKWIAFLKRIYKSNPEKDKIIDFLQRAIGYTLTGDTSERAIFLMHGLGANGKTVFIRVLEALFGDYGTSVSSSTFTTAMATNVRNDLARLKGKRFVWASENSTETTLDAENIKRWTGGDTVVCRFLFKEEFTYRPNFKIWWIFNHKPKIKDATDSIWDRINLIPCDERIPKDEQDKRLSDKLLTELPGILNWALDGWKLVAVNGLQPPAAVKEATKEYRVSEDFIADFLDEYFEMVSQEEIDKCSINEDIRLPFKSIWAVWVEYTKQNNFAKTPSKQFLGRRLEERPGLKKYHISTEKGYIGLRFKRR